MLFYSHWINDLCYIDINMPKIMKMRKNNLQVHLVPNSHHMIFSSCWIFIPSFIQIWALLPIEFSHKAWFVTLYMVSTKEIPFRAHSMIHIDAISFGMGKKILMFSNEYKNKNLWLKMLTLFLVECLQYKKI